MSVMVFWLTLARGLCVLWLLGCLIVWLIRESR